MTKKEERRLLIKASARVLFIDKTIELTTFNQIAAKAGVGEATVYRHYSNKGELALEIAIDYAADYSDTLTMRIDASKGSHLDKFELVLDYFIELFNIKPDYFIYLEHFDNYVMHNDHKIVGVEVYEHYFLNISQSICDVDAGEVPDASVRKDVNIDMATHTFAVSYISLCQKLLLRGHIFGHDDRYHAEESLNWMKSVMLNSLKA